MKQPKPCSLFELMCDIVLYWAEDHKMEIPIEAMNDLRVRLSKAQRVLSKQYTCKKANRIELEVK